MKNMGKSSGIRFTLEQFSPDFRRQISKKLAIDARARRTILLMTSKDQPEELPKEIKPAVKKPVRSELEQALENQLLQAGITDYEIEYRFDPTRKWRADFAFIPIRLLVEVEGGIWMETRGRHTRGSGYTNDCEKYNAMCLQKWSLLRFAGQHIANGYALQAIQSALRLLRVA